jgi:hypothetical protein
MVSYGFRWKMNYKWFAKSMQEGKVVLNVSRCIAHSHFRVGFLINLRILSIYPGVNE